MTANIFDTIRKVLIAILIEKHWVNTGGFTIYAAQLQVVGGEASCRTLVNRLMVVLTIISIVGLLIPAVQSAREAAELLSAKQPEADCLGCSKL